MFFQQIEENLGIVDHVKESRLSTMFFCAADKIAKSIMGLIKEKKVTNMTLFAVPMPAEN